MIEKLKRLSLDSTPTIGKPCPLRDMHICTVDCALYLENLEINDCTLRVLAKLLFDFNEMSKPASCRRQP